MANQNNTIIKIEHLCKSFGDKVVLDDINLDIRKGEFITLLGPSGCGKTTLLRMIAGFLRPDSGVILTKQGEKEFYSNPKDLPSNQQQNTTQVHHIHQGFHKKLTLIFL